MDKRQRGSPRPVMLAAVGRVIVTVPPLAFTLTEQWEAINKAGIIEELTPADTEGEAEILLAQIYPSVAIGDGDPGVIVAGIIDHNNAAKIIRYLDPKGYKRQVMNGDIEPWPDEVDQLRAACNRPRKSSSLPV